MNLLHTSDRRLGARLGRHDRAPDHLKAIRMGGLTGPEVDL